MAAEKAQVISASNIVYVDSTLFNGYVTFSLVLNLDGFPAPTLVTLRDAFPALRVPGSVKIPIREGVLDPNMTVWRTDAFVPPGLMYLKAFYDSNNSLIASDSTAFTITSSIYTLPLNVIGAGDGTLFYATMSDAQYLAMSDTQYTQMGN